MEDYICLNYLPKNVRETFFPPVFPMGYHLSFQVNLMKKQSWYYRT